MVTYQINRNSRFQFIHSPNEKRSLKAQPPHLGSLDPIRFVAVVVNDFYTIYLR